MIKRQFLYINDVSTLHLTGCRPNTNRHNANREEQLQASKNEHYFIKFDKKGV